MSDESRSVPPAEQVMRADRLRAAISNLKRVNKPAPKTPRDLAQQAAAEAARRAKSASR
jgi:hypothetical protein